MTTSLPASPSSSRSRRQLPQIPPALPSQLFTNQLGGGMSTVDLPMTTAKANSQRRCAAVAQGPDSLNKDCDKNCVTPDVDASPDSSPAYDSS